MQLEGAQNSSLEASAIETELLLEVEGPLERPVTQL